MDAKIIVIGLLVLVIAPGNAAPNQDLQELQEGLANVIAVTLRGEKVEETEEWIQSVSGAICGGFAYAGLLEIVEPAKITGSEIVLRSSKSLYNHEFAFYNQQELLQNSHATANFAAIDAPPGIRNALPSHASSASDGARVGYFFLKFHNVGAVDCETELSNALG